MQYKTKKPDYISAFWNLINWGVVSERFSKISCIRIRKKTQPILELSAGVFYYSFYFFTNTIPLIFFKLSFTFEKSTILVLLSVVTIKVFLTAFDIANAQALSNKLSIFITIESYTFSNADIKSFNCFSSK